MVDQADHRDQGLKYRADDTRIPDPGGGLPLDHDGDVGRPEFAGGQAAQGRGSAQAPARSEWRPGRRVGARPGEAAGTVPGQGHVGGEEAGAILTPVRRAGIGEDPAEAPECGIPPGAGRGRVLRGQGHRHARRARGRGSAAGHEARHDAKRRSVRRGPRGRGFLPPRFRRGLSEEEAGRVDVPRHARCAGSHGRLRGGGARSRCGDAAGHQRAGLVVAGALRGVRHRQLPVPDGTDRAGRSSATWGFDRASRTSGRWPP